MRIFVTIVIALTCCFACSAETARAPKSVLIVQSYHSGYEWTADVTRGLHDSFRESPTEIRTWVEFLDSRRNPDWQRDFHASLASKHRGRRFELVILVDDEAVEIFCAAPERINTQAVVVGGVTTKPDCAALRTVPSTGLLENFNNTGLIEVAARAHPQAKEMVIVTDQTTIAKFLSDSARPVATNLGWKITEWRADLLGFDEIVRRASQLDSSQLLFVTNIVRDKDGTYLPPAPSYRRIGAAASVPTITLSHQPTGWVLAGSPNTGMRYGQELGAVGRKILAGVDPRAIPVIPGSKIYPQVEGSELERWKISEEVLPPDVEIVRRPVSFFRDYRGWIIGIAMFLVAQSALLLALGFSNARRRRAERQLVQANQKLAEQNEDYRQALAMAAAAAETKNRFLANMSHELRTPLNGVLGMSDFLLGRRLDTVERSCIETVHSSAKHLLVILNDILDTTRLESGQLRLVDRPYSPATILEECRLLFRPADAGAIELRSIAHPNLPAWLLGDPARVRQVIFNLVGNAIKFTHHGSIEVAARVEEGWLKVSVTDTGIGIPADELAGIFEPFVQVDDSTTRRQGGLGLGLAIARQLAEAMGGTLTAVSNLGEGSCFTLRLPARLAQPEEPTPAPSATDCLRGRRVLVVEDNAVNQRVITRLLESLGCVAIVADNGLEGLRTFENAAFDAVLMDLQMPVMDGLTAVRRIRTFEAGQARCLVVALTASALEGDRERCLAAGMDDFLAKPVDRRAIEQMLTGWLCPT
jgi:signal transduction histidine kinase/BarA-like signal transduction histidine kinase